MKAMDTKDNAMPEPDLWWIAAYHARSPEVWAGIAAGMIYVYGKSPLAGRAARATEAAVSGLLAYSTGPWVANWASVSEPVAVIVLSSVGYLILDLARSIVADRQIFKDIIIRRLGGGGGGGNG